MMKLLARWFTKPPMTITAVKQIGDCRLEVTVTAYTDASLAAAFVNVWKITHAAATPD